MTEPTVQKFCVKCHVSHPLSDFSKDKSRPTGYALYCRSFFRGLRARKNPRSFEPDLLDEHWKAIPNHRDYAVSDLGRVKRIFPQKGAQVGRIQRASPGNHGYPVARLNGRCYTVHSLVALAFIGPCPPGHEVNHKDGVKTNARLDNLEYATYKENVRHAFRTGLAKSGEHHHLAKLTNATAAEVYRLAHEGILTQKEIGQMFGIASSTVAHIKRGRYWSHAIH